MINQIIIEVKEKEKEKEKIEESWCFFLRVFFFDLLKN